MDSDKYNSIMMVLIECSKVSTTERIVHDLGITCVCYDHQHHVSHVRSCDSQRPLADVVSGIIKQGNWSDAILLTGQCQV